MVSKILMEGSVCDIIERAKTCFINLARYIFDFFYYPVFQKKKNNYPVLLEYWGYDRKSVVVHAIPLLLT